MDLRIYFSKLFNSKKEAPCRRCRSSIHPKHFEKHYSNEHGFNPKKGCVWCEKHSWEAGLKHKNVAHLLECFVSYMTSLDNLLTYPPSSLEPPPTPLITPSMDHSSSSASYTSSCDDQSSDAWFRSTDHEFLERHLYTFDQLPAPEHDWLSLLDDPDLQQHPVAYEDTNLNLAASYCIFYARNDRSYDFLHVAVSAAHFDSFNRALGGDRDLVRTFQFSCWCDEGPRDVEIRVRQHRHLVLAAPKGLKRRAFWSSIGVPGESSPCQLLERISSYMHLANTLVFLSGERSSSCPLSAARPRISGLAQFYFYKTLPENALLCLSVLCMGEFEAFLHQTQFSKESLKQILGKPLVEIEGVWKQKIRDSFRLGRGLVLPVSKRFMATKTPTDYYLHLLNGRMLYFECSHQYELLDDDEWLASQIRGGNAFYDNVEDEWWTPPHQDFLEHYASLKDQNARLKERIDALTAQVEEDQKEIKELMREVARTMNDLICSKNQILSIEAKDKKRAKRRCRQNGCTVQSDDE